MSDLPWDTDVVDDQPELPVERRRFPQPSTIVFASPDRGRAQRECDVLFPPNDVAPAWEDWEVGEPRTFGRVVRRTPAWVVVERHFRG